MIATERLRSEQQFHDRQAAERAAYFAEHQDELVFADAAYLDHETWVRPAFAKLGDVRGKVVLDYGCGHGMASVVLARQGAAVTGIDLSPGYVAEARRRAAANAVDAQFLAADAHALPFPNASFDRVWGCAILHHLDLEKAGRELARVLRPDGVAVFCEPWGGNPLLRFARRRLPYAGKGHTPDERPLRHADLRPLRSHFRSVEVSGFQLLGMLRRIRRRVAPGPGRLERWDAFLLRSCPLLENWCRYVVITLRR
jgi:SAM-dependent methyltransferase